MFTDHLRCRISRRNYIMFTDLQCPGDSACSNHGTCDFSTGTCVCNSGFQGDICQGKNFILLTKLYANQIQN